jgi:hypothetical protein
MANMGYEYHKLDTPPNEELELHEVPQKPSDPATNEKLGTKGVPSKTLLARHPTLTRAIAAIMFGLLIVVAAVGVVNSAIVGKRATSTSSSSTAVPQYFQTTPEIYAGTHFFNCQTQCQLLISA